MVYHACVRAERPAHRWHGGQVEVGGDGREAHQRAQDSEHAPAVADRLGARRGAGAHDCGAIGGIAREDGSGGDMRRGDSVSTPDKMLFTGSDSDLLPVKDVDRDQIRLLARREVVAVLRRDRRTWVHTVREEFATYYPLANLTRWLGGDPFVQVGRHAIVNLQAIEHATHYGDRLYRVRLRDRVGTEITASRTGAVRLAAVLKTQR